MLNMALYKQLSGIVLACSLASASAQIPNGSFENWVDMGGFLDPVGWHTYNDAVPGGAVLMVEPGTPGAVGNYHAVITTRNVPGGVSPIQGWMSAGGQTPGPAGFPYNTRPAMLTGQWQYDIQPMDTAQVQVSLINSTNQTWIAHGTIEVTGSLDSWQMFQVPLTYFSSDIPDTAYIQIASSINFVSPVAGSFVKVDDLAFAGSVGLDEQVSASGLLLFPSPGADVLNISISSPGELRLFDATGRIVFQSRVSAHANSFDVSNLVPGLFTYQYTDLEGDRIASGRWVKE